MNEFQAHRDMDEMAAWADQHRAECRRVFAPVPLSNSSGSKAVDFATFWQIRLPLRLASINWWKTGMLLGCVLCACLMATGIAGLLGLWGYGR